MCGIVGILNKNNNVPVTPSVLRSLSGKLRYRGPDDAGVYIDRQCGLAHQRLSIIDLTETGHQPMSTSDGRYTIVFNGEIYNYQELRDRHLHDFKLNSSSDTEVLLYLLATIGTNILSELRGMFALGLWDRNNQELLLARDRFGKKPLYYTNQEFSFLFASEIKSLLAHPEVSAHTDPSAIIKYLLYEYTPVPASGYTGIKQLPMGSYARITKQGITIQQWWKTRYTPQKTFITETKALNQLDKLLFQATQRRLVADVPVGLFLSGGLDSTTIAWYMQQLNNNKVHSFSVSFTEKTFNESHYAEMAASSLGTKHYSIQFNADDVITTTEELRHQIDIPLADPIMLPTYQMSKIAKKQITVTLSGEGSDELLAGYNTYRAADTTRFFSFLPHALWAFLEKIAQAIPTQYEYSTLDSKIKTFLRGVGYPLIIQNQLWIGSFTAKEMDSLLNNSLKDYINQIFEDIIQDIDKTKQMPPLDALSFINTKYYLQNYLLTKLDRSTMYASLEARTPFLDIDLSEFIMRLPIHLKRNKYLLRKLMRGRIPNEIIDRSKQGFSLPLGPWLRGPLYNWASNILSLDNLKEANITNPQTVRNVLQEHKLGKADHHKKIWTLITLHIWYKNWTNHNQDTPEPHHNKNRRGALAK